MAILFQNRAMPIEVALQLYTIRSETSKDFIGACERVKRFGCDNIELAGFGGMRAKDLAKALNGIGLRAIGSHVGIESVIESSNTIDDHLELGCKLITVPWLANERRATAEAWRATGQVLEEAVHKFRDAGIQLGYHNHSFEFEPVGEQAGWEILFDAAPSIDAQVDVYWAAKGSRDPSATIRSLPGRTPTIHAKDLAEDGGDIELGNGILDWESIKDACVANGVQFAIVEMDNPRLPPLESAEACVRFAKSLFSV